MLLVFFSRLGGLGTIVATLLLNLLLWWLL
jgi:hypothetical protein